MLLIVWGLPRVLSVKEPACQCRRHGSCLWVRKIPWRRKWQNPLQCFCLENPMDSLRSLASYSPWGREALDTAESAHTGTGLLCIITVLLTVTRKPNSVSGDKLGHSVKSQRFAPTGVYCVFSLCTHHCWLWFCLHSEPRFMQPLFLKHGSLFWWREHRIHGLHAGF